MDPEPALSRCRRGDRCADRVRLVDDETGKHLGWDGILLDRPGLCPTDTRLIKYDIQALPGDVAELSELLVPSGELRYRDPDMPAQPRQKLVTPVPLDLEALTLQELIDTETTIWATAVARAVGLDISGAWSSLRAARSRQHVRVETACALLSFRLQEFLDLPVTETPARSLTTRRGDGHDQDTTTVYGDDWWTHRDGVTAALLLSDLHDIATAKANRQPADRLPLPCPFCQRPALIRLHFSGRVECKACGERITDQEYDGHLFHLGTKHKIDAPRTPPARKDTAMPERLPDGVQHVRPLDVQVHALLVTEDNLEAVRLWCAGNIGKGYVPNSPNSTSGHWVRWVNVPGALRHAYPGDIVVRHPERDRPGVFRVLTADEFAASYEQAA